jgi:methyl-accepting chemotaxis protein
VQGSLSIKIKKGVIMQLNEIRQRVVDVEQSIHRASQACQNDASVPQQLKQYVRELDQQSVQVKKLVQKEQDESRIRQSIDDLEALGDRAKQACEQSANVTQEVKKAVLEAHDELSRLKHQLH